MKYRLISCSVIAVAILGLLSLTLPETEHGRPTTSVEAATVPRMPDGHPDLSGFWFDAQGDPLGIYVKAPDGTWLYDDAGVRGDGVAPDAPKLSAYTAVLPMPPYTSEYLAKVKATAAQNLGEHLHPGDPYMQCKPLGIPRVVRPGHHYGFQIVQHARFLALLYEEGAGSVYRLIYTDGRAHPENLDTSYFGHSIGHWEGDTLVVDVTGLNEETLLDDVASEGPTAGMLLLHSDKEHVVERWTRNANMLTYEATVEDPVAFTKPMVIAPRHIRLGAPDDFIRPLTCNNAEELSHVQRIAKNPH